MAGKMFRDLRGSGSIAGAATATLISQRWVSIPGTITWLAMDISDVTLWATATFSLKINGIPALDYGVVQDQIGRLSAPTLTRIPIPPDALVEVTATNGGAVPSTFAARLEVEG